MVAAAVSWRSRALACEPQTPGDAGREQVPKHQLESQEEAVQGEEQEAGLVPVREPEWGREWGREPGAAVTAQRG